MLPLTVLLCYILLTLFISYILQLRLLVGIFIWNKLSAEFAEITGNLYTFFIFKDFCVHLLNTCSLKFSKFVSHLLLLINLYFIKLFFCATHTGHWPTCFQNISIGHWNTHISQLLILLLTKNTDTLERHFSMNPYWVFTKLSQNFRPKAGMLCIFSKK